MQILNIGVERAAQKIKQFCAYQERSQQEVRNKLYTFGLRPHEIETLISELIQENFLNEERYAVALAGGKFRIKHWGRNKIKQALQQQKVSSYCIKKAFSEIDDAAYKKTFEQLANKKLELLRSEKNIFTKKAKLQRFLLQKGYESELVHGFLKTM